jgi:TPR repeat protein
MIAKPYRLMTLVALSAALCACSVGVKRTPGMKLYSAGQVTEAIPLLESEVASGQATARYPLGLAYRDGAGVAVDPVKAEILLTGAAIGGDPRAVSAIRQLLETGNRCAKDKALHDMWGGLGVMYRNLITGVVELNNAPPGTLRAMAEIYDFPCPGAPAQAEAAKSLRALSQGTRTMWIYIPG